MNIVANKPRQANLALPPWLDRWRWVKSGRVLLAAALALGLLADLYAAKSLMDMSDEQEATTLAVEAQRSLVNDLEAAEVAAGSKEGAEAANQAAIGLFPVTEKGVGSADTLIDLLEGHGLVVGDLTSSPSPPRSINGRTYVSATVQMVVGGPLEGLKASIEGLRNGVIPGARLNQLDLSSVSAAAEGAVQVTTATIHLTIFAFTPLEEPAPDA